MYNGQTISNVCMNSKGPQMNTKSWWQMAAAQIFFQMSTLIHRIVNCPFKMTLILIYVILHKNLQLDNWQTRQFNTAAGFEIRI